MLLRSGVRVTPELGPGLSGFPVLGMLLLSAHFGEAMGRQREECLVFSGGQGRAGWGWAGFPESFGLGDPVSDSRLKILHRVKLLAVAWNVVS